MGGEGAGGSGHTLAAFKYSLKHIQKPLKMLEAVRVVGVVVRGGRVVGVVKVVKARWRQAKTTQEWWGW